MIAYLYKGYYSAVEMLNVGPTEESVTLTLTLTITLTLTLTLIGGKWNPSTGADRSGLLHSSRGPILEEHDDE